MLFEKLEKKFGITIPSDFKIFQKLIEIKNPVVEYFDDVENFSFRLTKWLAYKESDIRIDVFYDADNLEYYWSKHEGIWGTLDYLPFGSLIVPHAGVLLYSNLQEELGAIYYTKTGSREPVFLAESLFSFLESIKHEIRDEKRIMMSKLFKNWGEDFWRIK